MPDPVAPVELIILGMHRSGTSSVAGFFQQSGWYFGPPNQSFDLHATNQKGFFERRDVVRLNDRLLDSYGASWITPERFPRTTECPVDFLRHPEHAEAASIIEPARRNGHFFLKDPRMCVTLPFWLPLLRNPFFLLVVRHPLNVARSLAARRDCGLAAGFALWERYTRDMFHHTQGHPRAVVHFEHIMADPAGVMTDMHARINRANGGHLPLPSTDCAEQWFESDLVHHTADAQALANCAPEPVVRLYRDLLADGENAQAVREPLSLGARHALAELAEEVRQRQQAPSHAAMWHARHTAIVREASAAGRDHRLELEALLQSWRWKLPDHLARLLGQTATRARHGFDTVLMRRDADAANERMNCEAGLLATARRTFPVIRLPHEIRRPDDTGPRSVLLVSIAESPSLAASWLIAFTEHIATRGHRVDWLTRHEVARTIDDLDLPVFAHSWKKNDGEPFGMEIFEPLLDTYDMVILDGAFDEVWHPPLQEVLRRAHRDRPDHILALNLAADAAPCRMDIAVRAHPRFDLTIIANTDSDTSVIARSFASNMPTTRHRIALLNMDRPLSPEWRALAEQSGWTCFDHDNGWSKNLAVLADSRRCLAIRPIDLVWPTAAGCPGYLWSDDTARTLAAILSGVHDVSAMRYDQFASRIHALRQAEQRVLDALDAIARRTSP